MPLTDGASVSIPAGGTVNVIAGHPLEFIGAPSTAALLATADAPGLTQQFLINVGGNQSAPVAAGVSMNTADTAGQGPKDDEDIVSGAVALPAGSRSQWNVSNPTGAPIVMRWKAYIQP